MNKFVELFGRTRSVVIGMIHLRALPGSPGYCEPFENVVSTAVHEASIYKKANVDGVMLENMHDRPWRLPHQMGPETCAAMTTVASAVRREFPGLPLGIQILSAANKDALAVAKVADLNFIRAEGFVYSHIGDEGPIHSCAAELLRYRKQIGAENVHIFTDIKKKHSSHAITSDVSLVETAKAAQLFLSDGLIISGMATGTPTDPKELTDVQSAVGLPVLVGSGVTEDNLDLYISANAVIVGSHFKAHGEWDGDLDRARVDYFMKKVRKLREQLAKLAKDDQSQEFPPFMSQGE